LPSFVGHEADVQVEQLGVRCLVDELDARMGGTILITQRRRGE